MSRVGAQQRNNSIEGPIFVASDSDARGRWDQTQAPQPRAIMPLTDACEESMQDSSSCFFLSLFIFSLFFSFTLPFSIIFQFFMGASTVPPLLTPDVMLLQLLLLLSRCYVVATNVHYATCVTECSSINQLFISIANIAFDHNLPRK